jgi:hypothetical protein
MAEHICVVRNKRTGAVERDWILKSIEIAF